MGSSGGVNSLIFHLFYGVVLSLYCVLDNIDSLHLIKIIFKWIVVFAEIFPIVQAAHCVGFGCISFKYENSTRSEKRFK